MALSDEELDAMRRTEMRFNDAELDALLRAGPVGLKTASWRGLLGNVREANALRERLEECERQHNEHFVKLCPGTTYMPTETAQRMVDEIATLRTALAATQERLENAAVDLDSVSRQSQEQWIKDFATGAAQAARRSPAPSASRESEVRDG